MKIQKKIQMQNENQIKKPIILENNKIKEIRLLKGRI